MTKHEFDLELLKEEFTRLKAENERLKRENEHYAELEQGCYVSGYKNIRTASIKEFAERLKKQSGSCVAEQNGVEIYGTKLYMIYATTIDTLLKEMEVE